MTLGVILAAMIMLAAGCKKQPKCGCNGDALDTLRMMHVNISYDAINKTARFTVIGDPYGYYHFCNPSEWMSVLSKFEQGEEVLVSGPYFWECNFMMQNSNSPYYSYWRIYQVHVTDLSAYEYGK